MTEQKQKEIWIVVAYIAVYIVLALFTAAIGTAILLKDITAMAKASIVLPVAVGIFVCYFATMIYARYILNKDKDIECSVLKGNLIILPTLFLNILASCTVFTFGLPGSMPIAFSSLIITMMLRQRLGLMCTFTTTVGSLLLCAMVNGGVDLGTIIALLSSALTGIFMIFLIRRRYTRLRLTWGTILIAVAMIPFTFLLGLVQGLSFAKSAIELALETFIGNMISIASFTITLPIYESIFRIWTDFKLAELCSFNQPLLKKLREEASGTFNHSMIVANLAENCAIAIGINPFMARACAYFHDIGKIKNPRFFVENQMDGYNPHDELIPEVSASMITRHVADGTEILKEYRMPNEVIKAAGEHHGDSPVMYFYLKAKVITEGELDMDEYRYDSDLPTTKYSAIIMICDVCEAMIRSKAPNSDEELDEMIGGIIKDKMLDGQFDNCDLTIHDMVVIKQTICNIIPTMLHKRIDYNKAKDRR